MDKKGIQNKKDPGKDTDFISFPKAGGGHSACCLFKSFANCMMTGARLTFKSNEILIVSNLSVYLVAREFAKFIYCL